MKRSREKTKIVLVQVGNAHDSTGAKLSEGIIMNAGYHPQMSGIHYTILLPNSKVGLRCSKSPGPDFPNAEYYCTKAFSLSSDTLNKKNIERNGFSFQYYKEHWFDEYHTLLEIVETKKSGVPATP